MSPSKINLVDDASGSPSQTDKNFIDLASGTVTKPSTQAAEEEAPAQAEAAEQKLKFEQQDKISGGKHDDVHSESAQNSEDQNDSRNHTNENGMHSNEIPSSRESDSAHGAIQNQMTEKVSFELTWSSKGKDIVSFEKGNIKTAGHTRLVNSWLYMRKKKIYVQPSVRGELLGISSSFKFVKTWQDEREIPDLHKKVDLVITLGGDGTVLWAASLFQGPVPPVVSFNLGSLGFMTPFGRDGYKKQLESILKGPIRITLRRRLQCQIVRDLAAENENATAKKIFVLNEVTIDRGQSPYLTNLKCYCDDKYVTLVQGDGLILSTTSGSTAYSLAAGGSMVHPQVPGIVLTPICPHSLSFRPLILPDHVVIGVEVADGAQRSSPLSPSPSPRTPSRHSSASVSFDGKGRQELTAGNKLKCSMAPWPVPTVCLNDSTRDFLCSILEGLHWNLRKTQLSDGPTQQSYGLPQP